MSDQYVNPHPLLPNVSGAGPDTAFLSALLVALMSTFAEYGKQINEHERRLDEQAAAGWIGIY